MPKTPLIPEGAAPPMALYSPGLRSGNMIFVSGVLAMNSRGETVGRDDVRTQTRQVIENIQAVLKAGGATLDDVTFNTIILKDLSDYHAMNEVYGEYFEKCPPARYCIRADLVKPDFLVEIASIAVLEI